MNPVLAIDPGPEESGWVVWDGSRVRGFGNEPNRQIVEQLLNAKFFWPGNPAYLAIEQIRGFGVMASDKLFDTCMWTGRFLQAWGESKTCWVPRKEAAKHVCGVGGISKDSFVREALIARLGPVGTKKAPGPLYGISGHLWAALAVGVTWWDLHGEKTA